MSAPSTWGSRGGGGGRGRGGGSLKSIVQKSVPKKRRAGPLTTTNKARRSANSSTAARAQDSGSGSFAGLRAMAAADDGSDFLCADKDEDDESDQDMGFGVFDSGKMIRSYLLFSDAKRRTEAALAHTSTKASKGIALCSLSAPKGKATAAGDPGNLLHYLISRQSFEGWWDEINDLCDAMRIDHKAARGARTDLITASKQTMDEKQAEQILSTALVIVYLEEKMEEDMDTWELVVEKARAWLDDAVARDVLEKVWELARQVAGV